MARLDVFADADLAGRHLTLSDVELLLARRHTLGLVDGAAAPGEEAAVVEVIVVVEVAAGRRAGADRAGRHRVARREVSARFLLVLARQRARVVGRSEE